MTANYLAFDLGAESGRAVLGRLHEGLLEIKDVSRFPNGPVSQPGSLRWDILRLWSEIKKTLDHPPVRDLASIAFDTWGVDYALIGEQGQLLENPWHYRDHRTDGMVEAVCNIVPREEIYSLTGNLGAEYTNATTTQFMDAKKRTWATSLFDKLNIPSRLLPQIFEPGATIGHFNGTPVIAPACHDTGSAVAAVATQGKAAFLSSGTWSLLGTEVKAPIMTPRALELNFTNEGGVCGTTRLLKNIGGLWLLQSCRRNWLEQGNDYSYDDLLEAARSESHSFTSLINPDHASFLSPASMVDAIAAFCRDTDQPAPETPGACSKAILESLAFKYRLVLESIEELVGHRLEEIRIIGGGSKNRLLNQFTANATGRPVIAGPVEATALGNIAMQMLATRAVSSLDDARAIIEHSFPTDRFEPVHTSEWEKQYQRFKRIC